MGLFKKNFYSVIVGCIVLFVTVCIYLLLPFKKESVDYFTFAGVAMAQVISLIALIIFNNVTSRKKLALSAGGYTSILVYLLLSVAASVLFSIYCRNAPKTYILVETVLTAVFVIALLSIYLTGNKIAADGVQAEAENYSFKTIEGNIDLMRTNPKNAVYRRELERIYEAYRSCDQSNYVKTDERIKEKIYELNRLLLTNPPDEHKTSELCELILQLIKQRGLEVNQLKLGGV